METKNVTAICESTNAVVPYLYNELASRERDEFESHLADCLACTDEFATISHARYSMYEWRKEEFDHLATPKFVIPDLATAETTTGSGWFAGLAAALSFARSPIAVAAVLLICLGVGLVAVNLLRVDGPQIASNMVEQPNLPSPPARAQQPADEPPVKKATDLPQPQKVSASPKVVGRDRPEQPAIKRAVNKAPRQNQLKQTTAQKPVLNDFDEDADESLRLADLFDEVGG